MDKKFIVLVMLFLLTGCFAVLPTLPNDSYAYGQVFNISGYNGINVSNATQHIKFNSTNFPWELINENSKNNIEIYAWNTSYWEKIPYCPIVFDLTNKRAYIGFRINNLLATGGKIMVVMNNTTNIGNTAQCNLVFQDYTFYWIMNYSGAGNGVIVDWTGNNNTGIRGSSVYGNLSINQTFEIYTLIMNGTTANNKIAMDKNIRVPSSWTFGTTIRNSTGQPSDGNPSWLCGSGCYLLYQGGTNYCNSVTRTYGNNFGAWVCSSLNAWTNNLHYFVDVIESNAIINVSIFHNGLYQASNATNEAGGLKRNTDILIINYETTGDAPQLREMSETWVSNLTTDNMKHWQNLNFFNDTGVYSADVNMNATNIIVILDYLTPFNEKTNITIKYTANYNNTIEFNNSVCYYDGSLMNYVGVNTFYLDYNNSDLGNNTFTASCDNDILTNKTTDVYQAANDYPRIIYFTDTKFNINPAAEIASLVIFYNVSDYYLANNSINCNLSISNVNYTFWDYSTFINNTYSIFFDVPYGIYNENILCNDSFNYTGSYSNASFKLGPDNVFYLNLSFWQLTNIPVGLNDTYICISDECFYYQNSVENRTLIKIIDNNLKCVYKNSLGIYEKEDYLFGSCEKSLSFGKYGVWLENNIDINEGILIENAPTVKIFIGDFYVLNHKAYNYTISESGAHGSYAQEYNADGFMFAFRMVLTIVFVIAFIVLLVFLATQGVIGFSIIALLITAAFGFIYFMMKSLGVFV